MRHSIWALIVAGVVATLPAGAVAQHAGVGTPLQSSGAGTSNQASSSISSTAGSVTTINGGTGSFIDATVNPFVIGMTPVVGMGMFPGSSVQLPTFSYFGVQTSVSVPDGGGMSLGGVGGGAEGGNQFGPNRSSGSQVSSRQMQVHVQIHDMAELDAQVLAAAAPPKPAGPPDANALALQAARASSAGHAAMSVADARRLHETQSDGQNDEARKWFDRAQQAESDGKPGTAKIYYQMAARRATGPLQATIIQHLHDLSAGGAAASVAQGGTQ